MLLEHYRSIFFFFFLIGSTAEDRALTLRQECGSCLLGLLSTAAFTSLRIVIDRETIAGRISWGHDNVPDVGV